MTAIITRDYQGQAVAFNDGWDVLRGQATQKAEA